MSVLLKRFNSYPIENVHIEMLIDDGVLKLEVRLVDRGKELPRKKAETLTQGDAEGSMNANDALTVIGRRNISGLIFRASACRDDGFRLVGSAKL